MRNDSLQLEDFNDAIKKGEDEGESGPKINNPDVDPIGGGGKKKRVAPSERFNDQDQEDDEELKTEEDNDEFLAKLG
jgi:hypothetical protein